MKQLNITGNQLRTRQRVISVYLIKNEDIQDQMYWCPYCRNAIMQYQGDLVTEIPGGHPTELPISIMCKNPNCRRKFRFIGFLEENI